MKHLIDRTRWPVLVTYSDEGQINDKGEPHNGFVYACSGWTSTVKNRRPVNENDEGARCSPYSNGKYGKRDLVRVGHTWVQRWENRICPPGEAANWMADHGWVRVPIPGKHWVNGKQAYRYVQRSAA